MSASAREVTDAAYQERNMLVAFLARVFPSGIARTSIEGWDPEWHGCVYIDTPKGQMSWHYHDRDAHLFAGLPAYTKPWDGHTTDEKYRRLAALSAAGFVVVPREPTEEMIKAYYHAMDGTHPTAKMNPRKALVDHHIKAQKRYRSMLSAAEGKK